MATANSSRTSTLAALFCDLQASMTEENQKQDGQPACVTKSNSEGGGVVALEIIGKIQRASFNEALKILTGYLYASASIEARGVYQNRYYLLLPNILSNIRKRLMKSRYKLKAPKIAPLRCSSVPSCT